MSKSNKQDYITGDKFIGDNDHYCLSYIYIYIFALYIEQQTLVRLELTPSKH